MVIVGGGLAGLAASIYLARAGRTVTIFEKRQQLGGRAITNIRHGYRFNIGTHTFYPAGLGAAVCRELGVPVRAAMLPPRGLALFEDRTFKLPMGVLSLLSTSLLSSRGKMELARIAYRIRRQGAALAGDEPLSDWLDANFSDLRARRVFESLVRQATLADHSATMSARAALAHMQAVLRGAAYVHEGWQRIVNSLHSVAVTSGVNFVTSSRVVAVEHDGAVRSVSLGGLEPDMGRMDTMSIAYPEAPPEEVEGTRLPAATVLLAVDPTTASALVGEGSWLEARPVTATCLDIALRALPNPKQTFALGIDQPLQLAVHSTVAHLTPKGGALIHVTRFRKEQQATDEELDGSGKRRTALAASDERVLEALLDRLQPGWREQLVHRRYLPAMTVANALVRAGTARPGVTTGVKGLFLAGDWVGDEGLLADASLASGRAAARAILSS